MHRHDVRGNAAVPYNGIEFLTAKAEFFLLIFPFYLPISALFRLPNHPQNTFSHHTKKRAIKFYLCPLKILAVLFKTGAWGLL